MNDRPALSVIITVDYRAGEDQAWNGLRDVLRALAAQATDEVEFVLVESAALRDALPGDLCDALPGLRVVFAEADGAGQLKNEGVARARADRIAMLDGDCVPAPGWLTACSETARSRPDKAVVSGRTIYPGDSLVSRVLALLNRSYVEGDGRGATEHVSQNNAVYRRATLEAAPFSRHAGTHSSRLQSEAMRRLGASFGFEPAMTVVHQHTGWADEREIRSDLGYSVVRVRREDPSVPHAWMTRLGILSVPAIFAARTGHSWWLCLKHAPRYRVRPYELPAAMLLAVVCCALEMPGVVRGLSEQARRPSSFR
jgi:hypothetical protein